MKKINKIVSILICMAMIFSVCSLIGFSFENEEEFNIEDYTWDDIMTMSNADFRALLTDFERVYDPFGTYETDPITAIYDENTNSSAVQPRWTSGNSQHTDTGSHELITARACGVLLDDKGFWGATENGSIIIALVISLASILPDTEEELGIDQLFAGHFYDPETEENWRGETNNTARKNAKLFYDSAVGSYILNPEDSVFYEYVGKLLHYVQDVCVPHHAANVTGLNPAHWMFEEYADENLNSYIDTLTTLNNSYYSIGLSKDIEIIVHDAALEAKGYIDDVDNIIFRSKWGNVAENTTRNAVINSVVVLYKLSIDLNIPLTK